MTHNHQTADPDAAFTVARASTVATRGRQGTKLKAIVVGVTMLAAVGVSQGQSSVVSADFWDCGNGDACLWSDRYMNSLVYSGPGQGGCCANQLAISAGSFGNRHSSACARFYRWDYEGPVGWDSDLLASASPGTGNSWSSTQTVDAIRISGTC